MKTMMSTDEFASHIPYGKDKAVTREFLCLLFGMSDRELRRMIQAARNDGHIIINNQSGCGYYRAVIIAARILMISKHSTSKTAAGPCPFLCSRNTFGAG